MKRLLLLSAICLAFAGTAGAQDKYPSKPIKIVVPYAPGGATDITSRLFGEQLKNILGQQVVVENKPGAFGILGIEEMARARPDGYTLFVGNVSTNAITPVLYKDKFKIDFEKEITSVSRLAIYPSFLITTAKDFDVKTVAELVANAKKNPGKIRYTSAGVGSFPHFDTEVFAKRAGIDIVHIPNKSGAAGMINDLVVGDVHLAFINVASTAAMVKAGSLRPLAVLAEKRLPEYPDIPTLAEVGYPGVGTLHWQSMLAPADTPKQTLATLHKGILDAAKVPELQEGFKKQLVTVSPHASLEEAQTWLKNELATWKKITSEIKIEMN
jgi:tripartite-type tricarboxylate transporter receptor subunit TctC